MWDQVLNHTVSHQTAVEVKTLERLAANEPDISARCKWRPKRRRRVNITLRFIRPPETQPQVNANVSLLDMLMC